MQIKNLSLQNFRNYEDEKFAFSEGLNILFGKNAQGKTNCAEAVFYLCTGTSLRIRHDRQLIKIGAPCARISAEAENRYGKVTIEADIYEDKREIRINGSKISKSADLMGHINSVFFSPGELRLIQDGPDERRRFHEYVHFSDLARLLYCFAPLQQDSRPKEYPAQKSGRGAYFRYAPVWDEQLCKYAAVIVEKRAEFLKKLAPYAKELHAFLTDGAEELEISPDRKYEGEEDEIAEKLKKQLSRNYEKDLRLGFTTVGPHRDDVDFFISGKDAKAYASQGQTRTAALSVKLSEVEIFRELSGEYPVLILDDVMSELDLPRRKKLLKRISAVQTILTCTHAERVLYGTECKKIRIENGKIKREKEDS